MLEVIDDAFSVQKIHGRSEEIPIQRLGKAEVLLSTGNVGNRDDLFKRDDLDRRDNGNDVYMAREHGEEKEPDHKKRPYRSSDEGLLLLFVIRQGRRLRFLLPDRTES